MCMNTILTYLKRGKEALLMLAVKLCADAAESDLPSQTGLFSVSGLSKGLAIA